MKKLVIAVFAVALAAAAQAATVTWDYTSTYLRVGDGTNTRIADGTLAYLVATDFAQSAAVSAFATAGSMEDVLAAAGSSLYAGTASSVSGKFQPANVTGSAADISAYFLVFNEGNMYVSTIADAVVNPLDPTSSTIAFTDGSALSKALPQDATSGYTTAGWYSAVPEPTSGLMMLLGMGVLALRRRRA